MIEGKNRIMIFGPKDIVVVLDASGRRHRSLVDYPCPKRRTYFLPAVCWSARLSIPL